MKKSISAALVILAVFTLGSAHAELVDNGGGLIYDTDLNITWLDYTYYKAEEPGSTWQAAMTWVAGLSVGGVTGWRLPTTPGTFAGWTDEGEMGHLYYTELGNPRLGPPITWGPFKNLCMAAYWSGTEYAPDTTMAWAFDMSQGLQGTPYKGANTLSGLAVRSGNISPSPALSEVVVYDHFNDGALDPAWSVSFNNATGWSYIESSSTLNVTEIAPVGPGWSSVNLTRHVTPIGEFGLNFDFSWDSGGGNRVMQNVLIQLYDDLDNKLVEVGYSDGWIESRGAKYAMIGGNVFDSGPDSMPLAGSAHVQVLRSGFDISVLWNGALLLLGTENAPVNRIDLVFSYCNFSDSGGNSYFVSESVDLIEVRTVGEFDFNHDSDVDGSDLAELIRLGGANIQQFAEDFGRVGGF